jgi:hypothetical protein
VKHMLLAALAAVSLSACTPGVTTGSVPVPAVLATKSVDETALRAAWGSFDVALDAINLWMDAKPSVVGTPKARRVADAIDAVSAALTAAQVTADALNAGKIADVGAYTTAMANAKIALTNLRAALKGD